MATTVRVKGLRELNAAFRKIDKSLAKEVREELKEVARPVAESAQSKISKYAGARVSSIRPRSVARGVFVTQGAKRVTGLRGDFGRLQMGHLEDALDEHAHEIVPKLEHALDRLTNSAGF